MLRPNNRKPDILSQIPPEVALYLLLFLDLPSILACVRVSRTWRALAEDNAVWRELFFAHDGWGIDLPRARARGWTPSSKVSIAEYSFYTAPTSNGASRLGYVMEEWARRRSLSQVTSRSASLSPRTISSPASWRRSRGTEPSIDELGDVAPLMLDWRALYKTRLTLDHRWTHDEPKVARLSGHADSVYCLEFDSTRIITGSRDRSIKVWSLLTGKLLATFRGHAGSVLCLKFDKDWDVGTAGGEEGEDEVRPGFMVSGSSDCSICVWDLRVGKNEEVGANVRAVLRGHTGGVLDLRIDDQRIVSW
jgi:F-box and WD-40 domain protein 1/11